MRSDVDRAEQRARQYWYDDGLTEIAAGCIFLAIGALFLAEAFSPPGSLPKSFSAIGLLVLVAGGLWITNWAVRWAKEKITYPRTGYVRYRRPARSRRRRLLTVLVAIVVSISINLILFATAPASLDWLPALQGLFIGLFLLYMAYQVGLFRLYLLAFFSAAAGLAITLVGVGEVLGTGIYFATTGLAIVFSGAATLALYLRNTRPPERV